MTQHTRRTVLQGLGALGVVGTVGVSAVSADGDEESGGDAKVRVAHAVPDAPAVDVLVNGSVAVSGAEFTDVTGYLELAEGEYDIAVNVAGTDATVFDTTVELDDEDFTVAATGNLEPEGDEPGFDLDVFEDKLGRIKGRNGRVRVYHLSPDAPAVDVAVAGEDDEPAVFLAEDIEFGEAGPNVEVAGGTYPVAVYSAGSDEPVFGPIEVDVKDGQVLSAFAEGELNPEDADGEDAGFTVVTASEAAAPFGRGRNDNKDEDDEEEEEDDEYEDDEEEEEDDD